MTDDPFGDPVGHDPTMGDRYTHPSWGVINFHRSQGTPAAVFGSSVRHQHWVSCDIQMATVRRNLNQDWIMGEKMVVRFRMSTTQFADAITGFGSGGGTPVTFEHMPGPTGGLVRVPEPPFDNKGERFQREMERDMQDMGQAITRLDALSAAIPNEQRKTERAKYAREVQSLLQQVRTHLPFLYEQFQVQMARTVVEAKHEVDAHVEHLVRQTGLEALRQQAPELSAPAPTVQQLVGLPEGGAV